MVGLFVLVGVDVGFLVGFDVVGISVRFTFCVRRADALSSCLLSF